MVDKKVIGLSSLGVIITGILLISMQSGDILYYCNDSASVIDCDNVSGGYCYVDGLVEFCTDDWLLIIEKEVTLTVDELLERQRIVNESFYNYDGCLDSCQGFCFYEGQEVCDCNFCDGERANFEESKSSELESIRVSLEALQ